MVYNLHFVCKLHEPITVRCTVCRQVCDMEEDILKDNTIAATVLRSSTSKYFSTVCISKGPTCLVIFLLYTYIMVKIPYLLPEIPLKNVKLIAEQLEVLYKTFWKLFSQAGREKIPSVICPCF